MEIINKIAIQLGIDSSEARTFCAEVRRFFVGPKPSLIQISKEIDHFEVESPSPQDIAAQYAEKLRKSSNKKNLNSKTSTDKEKSQTTSKGVKNKPNSKKKQKGNKSKKHKPKNNSNTGQYLKGGHSEDRFEHDVRNYQDDIPKCKHGVSILQTCRLCNPEKFEDDYRMD